MHLSISSSHTHPCRDTRTDRQASAPIQPNSVREASRETDAQTNSQASSQPRRSSANECAAVEAEHSSKVWAKHSESNTNALATAQNFPLDAVRMALMVLAASMALLAFLIRIRLGISRFSPICIPLACYLDDGRGLVRLSKSSRLIRATLLWPHHNYDSILVGWGSLRT